MTLRTCVTLMALAALTGGLATFAEAAAPMAAAADYRYYCVTATQPNGQTTEVCVPIPV